MNRRGTSNKRLILLLVILFGLACGNMYMLYAQETSSKALLSPGQKIAQLPVFEALREYQMRNVFSRVVLSRQMMEEVALAAFHNVHPGSLEWKEGVPEQAGIDLYVVTKDELYLYDKTDQDLRQVGDDRAGAVLQRYLARREALVGLIYVADTKVLGENVPAGDVPFYARSQADVLCQNVNLFCLSEGLHSMVKERIDHEALAAAMGLTGQQQIALVQFVGYPKQERADM